MFIRVPSATMMNNKIKWMVSGGMLTVLLFIFMLPRPVLILSAEGYADYYLEAETFELHWIHSIEKEEWYEIYEVEDDSLLLTKTYFKTFGAGVPHESETPPELTEDGYVGFTVNDTYPDIYMNVSENVKTKIIQNGEVHRLYKIFETNTAVEIRVEDRSLYTRLTGD